MRACTRTSREVSRSSRRWQLMASWRIRWSDWSAVFVVVVLIWLTSRHWQVSSRPTRVGRHVVMPGSVQIVYPMWVYVFFGKATFFASVLTEKRTL